MAKLVDKNNKVVDPMGGKKVFLSAAFLVMVEKGVFGLFRSLLEEQVDPTSGLPVREKIKDIGPIALFHESRPDEKTVMETFHPLEHRLLKLSEHK